MHAHAMVVRQVPVIVSNTSENGYTYYIIECTISSIEVPAQVRTVLRRRTSAEH